MEEPSPHQSSSSAAVLYCCWSCLDGRHKGDSSLQLHRCDQFLTHTKTGLYQTDLAQASAEAAVEVMFAQLLGVGVETPVLQEEGAVLRWSPGVV